MKEVYYNENTKAIGPQDDIAKADRVIPMYFDYTGKNLDLSTIKFPISYLNCRVLISIAMAATGPSLANSAYADRGQGILLRPPSAPLRVWYPVSSCTFNNNGDGILWNGFSPLRDIYLLNDNGDGTCSTGEKFTVSGPNITDATNYYIKLLATPIRYP